MEDHVLLGRIGRQDWEEDGTGRKTVLGRRWRWEEDGAGGK